MMIGMVAVWAFLIWGGYYFATQLTQRDARHERSAIEILEERFARGEIDRDELEDRRKTLQGI